MLKQKWKSIRQMSWQQILVNGICLCIILQVIVVRYSDESGWEGAVV